MAPRDRIRPTDGTEPATEPPEEGNQALLTGADTPAPEEAPLTPAPEAEAVTENPVAVHVPLESGKAGCYVIGDDGLRVRVPG